uniref:MAC-inhibitory protein n=1 Tax=Oreochromis aureus TaxID=47969 RepID=A0A668S714_OREAU
MKLLLLLLCFGTLHVGESEFLLIINHPEGFIRSGLRCYKCQDYTGRCQNVQECTYEDSCISLSERGGKTIRQCIRYTDCDNSRLSQMFPSISAFTYRCCSSNLCNSGTASTTVTPLVALLGSLLSLWWCWM